MNLVRGDLWSELGSADLILVTTCGVLDRNGRLVMGAGAALEAKQRFPEAPRMLGHLIQFAGTREYGLLLVNLRFGKTYLGAFQTKLEWREPARLELIETAARKLGTVAQNWERIAMNMPGVGHGRRSREEVLPLLAELPDNIFIYER